MSAVELAIAEVKKLSPREARELLTWLDARKVVQKRHRPKRGPTLRQRKAPPTKESLKAWHESVRLTTDWEPPRMPDDLVKRIVL